MVSFIVALGKNNAIGKDGHLPWHLPNDLKHFKVITEHHPVIMGRKTFESLPKILPNRHHIVITRDKTYKVNDGRVSIFYSLSEMLNKLDDKKEYFVIGGAEVFKALYPFCSKMYLTILERNFDADTFFLELDWTHWKVVQVKLGVLDDKNIIPHRFVTLETMHKAKKP